MIFTWYFEDSRECLGESVYSASDSFCDLPGILEQRRWSSPPDYTHMLVDQHDGNIFALGGEVVERLLNSRVLGLVIDHQEILLRIRRLGDMLQQI